MPSVSEVVDAQLDAYNDHDLERFVACYASDAVITNAVGDVLAQGHDDIRGMYDGLFANSPELHATIQNRIVVGNFVSDHEAVAGFNLPGSPTSFEAIAAYQLGDGKISRVTLYF